MILKKHSKYIYLTLALSIFISCSKVTDWEKFGIKKEVKNYKENYYDPILKNKKWEKGRKSLFGHNRVSFDKEGNYQLIEYFSEKDKLSGKVIPTREKGRVIEETFYLRNDSVINITKIEYISDTKQGFKVVDPRGNVTTDGKSLTKNNRIVKQKYKMFEGQQDREFLASFEYNEDGNMTSRKLVDANGELSYSYYYEYVDFDYFKNWTKRIDYDSEKKEEPINIVTREYSYY